MASVILAKIHATRASKLGAKFLAHVTDSGGVDDGRHFGDIVDKDAEIERFVAVLEVLQIEVFVDGRRYPVEMRQTAPHLLLESAKTGGQQASQTQAVPLDVVKAGALVPHRVVQHPHAGGRHLRGRRREEKMGREGGEREEGQKKPKERTRSKRRDCDKKTRGQDQREPRNKKKTAPFYPQRLEMVPWLAKHKGCLHRIKRVAPNGQ